VTIRDGILESIEQEDIVSGKLIIPEGVTDISKELFRDHMELISVELPTTLKKIGKRAFYDCSFLKNIKFNQGLQEIEEAAFYHCTSLSEVKLPDTVTEIAPHTFSECDSLRTVHLSKNISKINSFTFSECTSLSEIELPENIDEICEYAFYSCLSLREIKVPSNVKRIGSCSFQDCQFLNNVIFGEGLEEIKEYAFQKCFSLKKIILPKNLKIIRRMAFQDCTSLEDIKLNENLEVLEGFALENSKVKEIVFPKSIKVVAPMLLRNCKNLKRVHFKSEIEGICENCFSGCFSLSEIVEGNQVIEITNNDSTGDILIQYLYFYANQILKEKYESIDEFLENSNIGCLRVKAITNAGFMEDGVLKFKNIFRKLRKSYDVAPDILKYLKKETTENFSYKIWNEIKKNFSWECCGVEEREKSLAEMIEVFGLFHKDKNQKNRIKKFNEILNEHPFRIFVYQMEELLEDDYPEYKKEILESFDIKKEKLYFINHTVIPEEFSMYLSGILTLSQVKKIKNLQGNYGKRINEFIKEHYVLEEVEVYVLKEEKRFDEVIKLVLLSNSLENHINYDTMHRIFDGCDFSFHEGFYEFLMDNFELILSNKRVQTKIGEIGKCFDSIKDYYHFTAGIKTPSLKQALDYLEKANFNYKEGNLEFAQDIQKAGVTDEEKYNYYENIYEKNKIRGLYSLIRRSNVYEIDGYVIKAELLRKDDPFTLVVGETNYTNCCQVYHKIGHNCMAHATSSSDGGIFVTRLLKDGEWILLTESWDWQNNNLYCHDNIEGTEFLKRGSYRLKKAVAEAFKLDAESIIEKSKNEVGKYIESRRKILEKSISEEKELELEKLKELENRQVIKIVTVGTGYDDLGLREFFHQTIKVDTNQFIHGQVFHLSNFQPVDYNNTKPYFDSSYPAYSDSKEFQYIMTGSLEDLVLSEETLVPIYRDERRVMKETGDNVRNHTAKRIKDMEKEAYPRGMWNYQKVSQNNFHNTDIYLGEDWYLICENKMDNSIYIKDLARVTPTLEDEKKNQLDEIQSIVSTLIDSSQYIEADLKEDTSYILYLMNKRLGYIEQIGEDTSYLFGTNDSEKTVTEEEQMKILKNYVKTKEQNSYTMHKVKFKKK